MDSEKKLKNHIHDLETKLDILNRDYNKFVKWIGSSSQALRKATPDKKEIKKIGLGVGGFFGGGKGDGNDPPGGGSGGLLGGLVTGIGGGLLGLRGYQGLTGGIGNLGLTGN